jgi:uncharacterized protein
MNHLKEEHSPYLQQHANNPVHWYPWCDEAFERAKKEDKPIFVSIGYSACHWCHVMEREVFESGVFASVLNEHFIAIKVDKEERPDLDSYYQKVHHIMNKRAGGWPTSIFLTPTKKPFFAGTYIPPNAKYGSVGFGELLDMIMDKHLNNRSELENAAEHVTNLANTQEKTRQAVKIDEHLVNRTVKHAISGYDTLYGGFSKAPKFPHTSTLDILMDCYLFNKSKDTHLMIENTLDNMLKGGMWDLVDHGWCRYSTDEKWLVPHFEKMTYDNGLLAQVYLRASTLFDKEAYRKNAFETLDFMIEKMSREDLFYTASDADTEGVEGKYFVYDFSEVKALFEKEGLVEIDFLLRYLGITQEPNFEEGSIVRIEAILDAPEDLEKALKLLKEMRVPRTYPFIDTKVITAQNSMVIKALFMAGELDPKYLKQAEKSLSALVNKMSIDDTLYHSGLVDKTPKVEAFLEDYAYLADAYMSGYLVTLNPVYLIKSQDLVNRALVKFYENGKWYFSKGEFVSVDDASDSSYPAASAMITQVMISLGALVDEKYREFAYKAIEFNSIQTMQYPSFNGAFTKACMRFLKEDMVIKGKRELLEPNLAALNQLDFPYILPKEESIEGLQLCSAQSCFATFETFSEFEAYDWGHLVKKPS